MGWSCRRKRRNGRVVTQAFSAGGVIWKFCGFGCDGNGLRDENFGWRLAEAVGVERRSWAGWSRWSVALDVGIVGLLGSGVGVGWEAVGWSGRSVGERRLLIRRRLVARVRRRFVSWKGNVLAVDLVRVGVVVNDGHVVE